MTSMQIRPIFEDKPEIEQIKQNSEGIAEALTIGYKAMIQASDIAAGSKSKYINNSKHFLHFVQVNGVHPHTFQDFKDRIKDADLSVKTKNAYLTAARKLLTEAIKYRVLPIDITANIQNFKESKGHKKDGLTLTEVQKVAQAIQAIKSEKKRAKLSAIYNLFALEGLRQIEVVRLTVKDFSPKDGYILVHGKGKHDKEKFYITSKTVAALQQHIKLNQVQSGYIFSGRAGKQLSTRAIQKIFTDPKTGIFTQVGITSKTVHGFRHFFVTRTLEVTGGDITRTAQRSRHQNVQNVIIYNDERLSRQTVDDLSAFFDNVSL